jgi:hypothetical protein
LAAADRRRAAMRVSNKSDYVLRALFDLAQHVMYYI